MSFIFMTYNHQDTFPYFKKYRTMSATVRNQIAHMIWVHPYDLQDQKKLIDGDENEASNNLSRDWEETQASARVLGIYSLIQMVITWVNIRRKIHNVHISALYCTCYTLVYKNINKMQNSTYDILYLAQNKQKRKNKNVSTWICLNLPRIFPEGHTRNW